MYRHIYMYRHICMYMYTLFFLNFLAISSRLELGALICYNMATTMGSQGCSAHNVPAASVFNDAAPEKVDTDQWCGAIASFGGTYATIVAKHVCGFAIWETEASLYERLPRRYFVESRTLLGVVPREPPVTGVRSTAIRGPLGNRQ